MEGKIFKALSGFYYVKTENNNVYECRAKGAFKNEGITPLVGDNVTFQVTDADAREGIVKEIHPRKNELVRPSVANVDQAMVVFAVKEPNPNYSILDRFLVLMQKQNVPVIVVFNKKDLAKDGDIKAIKKVYKDAGCKLFFLSARKPDGSYSRTDMMLLKMQLRGKVTVMAGPSGVGKSTLLNKITSADSDESAAATGELSKRIGRGKHTTRHNQLYEKGGYQIIDTPGFTSLLVNSSDYTRENLKEAIPEFAPYESQCPFKDCSHIKERDCAVKKAVEEKKIPVSRYNSYKAIYEELGSRR